MNNIDLSNLIFPDINKSIEYYKDMYPSRNLDESAKVTRFAPSPTGFVHLGNFETALINYILAKTSNGIFYLRCEDTDQSRKVDGSFDKIVDVLNKYNIKPDEYEFNNNIVGNYGPYIQSKRREIYHTFIKYLIQIGKAYPCFCTKEQLNNKRKKQEQNKERIGYYGRHANCRNLSIDEQISNIKNGIPYVIRFKSSGDNNKRFDFNDLVRGIISLPENDQDFVIMKSNDRLPTYHFAHFVDDYLMHTTHVVRGEEWLSSVPIHIELFQTFNTKHPKYIHIPLLLKKEGNNLRKISKRKDPEASMTFYEEKGYPTQAVIESLMTIINSNYETWHDNNKDKIYLDFIFSPKKMSATGGALYDIEKLNNISKNYISKLSAKELYNRVLNWSKKYDKELELLLKKYPEYTIKIFNIEREQKNPRKDFICFSDIKNQICYMYDELFKEKNYEFDKITDHKEIEKILKAYIDKYYDINDDKDTWFNKLKLLSEELGYASNIKEYKLNLDKYKGSIADISTVIRVALTTKKITPDLYEILKILGKERIKKRFEVFYLN